MIDTGRLERLETDFRGQIDRFETFKDALSLQLQALALAVEQAKSYGKFDKWAVGIMTGLIGGMAMFILDHWHQFS